MNASISNPFAERRRRRLDFSHPIAHHVACEHQMSCTLTPMMIDDEDWGIIPKWRDFESGYEEHVEPSCDAIYFCIWQGSFVEESANMSWNGWN